LSPEPNVANTATPHVSTNPVALNIVATSLVTIDDLCTEQTLFGADDAENVKNEGANRRPNLLGTA
jgi:hypothetical protein